MCHLLDLMDCPSLCSHLAGRRTEDRQQTQQGIDSCRSHWTMMNWVIGQEPISAFKSRSKYSFRTIKRRCNCVLLTKDIRLWFKSNLAITSFLNQILSGGLPRCLLLQDCAFFISSMIAVIVSPSWSSIGCCFVYGSKTCPLRSNNSMTIGSI